MDSKLRKFTKATGRVVSVVGAIVQADMPSCAINDLVTITLANGAKLQALAVGFHENIVTLAPLGETRGLFPNAIVENVHETPSINFVPALGQVVDFQGAKITSYADFYVDSGLVADTEPIKLPLFNPPPDPLTRRPIDEVLRTGFVGIDTLLTLGKGQRVGLFAPPGVGKSTLLGKLAQNADNDVTVIALVGERGREVREFIEHVLGPEGLKKSVVVVSTSDASSLARKFAPFTATAIAEYYRAKGLDVLLLVDSLTRTARAEREISLLAGEVPLRGGLTPSVYQMLPKLLERAGNDAHGTMTAIYTVLSSGGYLDDPLSEEIISLIDGHLLLSPELASRGVRPAIDYLKSVSRLKGPLLDKGDNLLGIKLLKILHELEANRELIMLSNDEVRMRHFNEQERLITSYLGEMDLSHHAPFAKLEHLLHNLG